VCPVRSVTVQTARAQSGSDCANHGPFSPRPSNNAPVRRMEALGTHDVERRSRLSDGPRQDPGASEPAVRKPNGHLREFGHHTGRAFPAGAEARGSDHPDGQLAAVEPTRYASPGRVTESDARPPSARALATALDPSGAIASGQCPTDPAIRGMPSRCCGTRRIGSSRI
jgi:hypothetical protein